MTIKLKVAYFFCCLFYLSNATAAHLGRINVIDSQGINRAISYQLVNGYAMIEGDIILAKLEDIKVNGAVAINKLGGYRWPQGIIPFEVNEMLPFKNKLAIYQAIDHIQQQTQLEFVELRSTNRQQYPDYISFVPAKGSTCSSYVGRQKGSQAINLSPRCTTMNTVHEISHALGLWHEQSRIDRDSYIKIMWENIEEDYKSNFSQHLTNSKNIGEYDYQSLMHYSAYAFSKNGQNTIVPLAAGVEIGQRKQLSPGDIAAIRAMYPEN